MHHTNSLLDEAYLVQAAAELWEGRAPSTDRNAERGGQHS
jgi:hypothetical protein